MIGRPTANGDDVFSAIMLILQRGSDEQPREYAALATRLKSTNPDYAAFLQMKLAQTVKVHH